MKQNHMMTEYYTLTYADGDIIEGTGVGIYNELPKKMATLIQASGCDTSLYSLLESIAWRDVKLLKVRL